MSGVSQVAAVAERLLFDGARHIIVYRIKNMFVTVILLKTLYIYI